MGSMRRESPMGRTDPALRARGGQRGFSYLWVLMSIAFMGVGLSLGADLHATASQRDRERELLAIGHQFRFAIASYREGATAAGLREYPATLDDLLLDPRVPGVRRHLRRVFIDPLTGNAEWGVVRVGGRIVGVHSLSAGVPLKQDGFGADDAAFRGRQSHAEWLFTHPAGLMAGSGEVDGAALEGAR